MIEIPGYQLVRELGRGGMATVYLAIQESVDREVALKVMSPALLADPNYGERFLGEARIAAKLCHPHVVGIHDVGRQGDSFYIAMEYLSGGVAVCREGAVRTVPFVLRIVREMASALHYAHAKGFVHRDVKSDNILLRDDSTSVLTDFGIARARASITRMTRTGAVVGTPHYMSPEQARGKLVDGRSDLYALGIVLYELLIGRVPYLADDSLAVGIMHITQPVPQLPRQLRELQPLLDRLLAKQPEDRFQDGIAVVAMVEELESRMHQDERIESCMTLPTYQSEIPTANGTRPSLQTPMPTEAHHRAEPSLGRLDDIATVINASQEREGMRTWRAKPRRGHRVLSALISIVAIASFFGWRYQDRLRAWLPNTELNELIARADQAFRVGRFSGSPDAARELYEQARAIDADNEIVRDGLHRVGVGLLMQARKAMAKRDFVAARERFADARAILAGGSEIDQLEVELHAAESHDTHFDALLQSADAALARGDLLGAGGAINTYQRVLGADAGNALAQAGLKKVGAMLAAQAKELIVANKLSEAAARIDDLARSLPNDPAVPDLRGDLTMARDVVDAMLDVQIKRGQELLRAGRIAGSRDSALAAFQAVLEEDPSNAKARAGIGQVAQALVVQANAALDEENADYAARLLHQAEQLAPHSAELAVASNRLRELREEITIAAQRPRLTFEQQQRVQSFIVEAEKAAMTGRLMLPPGESAYDRYRAALTLDPDNAAALEGLKNLPTFARDQFVQALADQKLDVARDLADTLAQLAPGDASLATLRARLADAYLDEAERRISENRMFDARRALDAARRYAPMNPRIDVVAHRLRSAGG